MGAEDVRKSALEDLNIRLGEARDLQAAQEAFREVGLGALGEVPRGTRVDPTKLKNQRGGSLLNRYISEGRDVSALFSPQAQAERNKQDIETRYENQTNFLREQNSLLEARARAEAFYKVGPDAGKNARREAGKRFKQETDEFEYNLNDIALTSFRDSMVGAMRAAIQEGKMFFLVPQTLS